MPKIEKPQDNTKKNIKRYKEQDPEKVKLYLQQICNIPKEKIVYVDETGIDTYLCREYCYAKRGEKVISYVYGRKYSRVGIVAAQTGKKIISPFEYKGTMNSQLFMEVGLLVIYRLKNGLRMPFYVNFLLNLL